MTALASRPRQPGGRARPAEPTVVFADFEPWEGFLQFAAALRRRGVRVERLTAADRTAVRRVNDLLQRPVFACTRPVLHRSSADVLAADVVAHLPASVAAWEAIDDIAAELNATPGLPLRTRSSALEGLLHDKLAMTRHAASHGLAVPRSWPAEAAHPLVPPFVVKPRTGAGGVGVRVITDEAAAARVAASARACPGLLLVQEWAPGELLHVGGVARAGSILQVAAYRAVGSPHAAFGPSTEVLTLDDPGTLDQATRLMDTLGYTGAFCLDYVRSADGRALLVDVNARVFGSWAALQGAGLDIVGAYLYAWGLRTEVPSGSVAPGRRLRVLPPDMALTGSRSLAGMFAAHLRGVAAGTPVLGRRWAFSTVCRLLCAVLVQARRRAGRPALPTGSAPDPRLGTDDRSAA
jgi:hypothetical protein